LSQKGFGPSRPGPMTWASPGGPECLSRGAAPGPVAQGRPGAALSQKGPRAVVWTAYGPGPSPVLEASWAEAVACAISSRPAEVARRRELRYVTILAVPPDTCAAPACSKPVAQHATGRPARYCSTACRVRAHRQRNAAPVTVEVDMGSARSRGRPPGRSWLVRLRRSDRSVIVAIGLRRPAAERLAAQLVELLGPAPASHG
jgi:hypothetical protein